MAIFVQYSNLRYLSDNDIVRIRQALRVRYFSVCWPRYDENKNKLCCQLLTTKVHKS